MNENELTDKVAIALGFKNADEWSEFARKTEKERKIKNVQS